MTAQQQQHPRSIGAARLEQYRQQHAAAGRKRREFYLTDSEFAAVQKLVAELRGDKRAE